MVKYMNEAAMPLTVVYFLAIFAGQCIADAAGPHLEKRSLHHSHHGRREFVNLDLKAREAEPETMTFIQYETIFVDQFGKFISSTLQTPLPEMAQYDNLVIPGSPTAMPENESPAPSADSAPPVDSPATSATTTHAAIAKSVSGDFPDGELDCSHFPSDYGALALGHLGLGGWSGVQLGDGTAKSCTDNAYCSYACPPGMTKSQWPATQPSDGETRGGLLCQGGKLKLTRPSVPKLCVSGFGSAVLVNKMSENVAVCGTDYPGTENMVVPVYATSGGTEFPLTVVDSASCFIWEGKTTSAQYYVNKAGVSVDEGCCWGSEDSFTGNWAPLIFGAGHTPQGSFLSLSPNNLAKGKDAGYDVEIVPDEGAEIVGACSYKNNAFHSDSGPSPQGCTVTVTKGKAKYVFSSR